MYLIHEGPDKEDTTAGATQDVLWRQGIWNIIRVEARALIGDADGESIGGSLERGGNLLGWIVGIPVKDSIDGCLADCHGDIRCCIFVEPGAGGELFSGLLELIHGGDGGGERE